MRADSPNTLSLPVVGSSQLQIISPTVLELMLITTKAPDPARPTQWSFAAGEKERLPDPSQFVVQVGERTVSVTAVGFKRRVAYAPLTNRDLRIGNCLYLQLAEPISDGETVDVANPSCALWDVNTRFNAVADPLRYSPAIHVNQVGYTTTMLNPTGGKARTSNKAGPVSPPPTGTPMPKKVMVGYYLGNLGELSVAPGTDFKLVNTADGTEVFGGQLKLRQDAGFNYLPAPYQKVLEADFTEFKTPGEYRLVVPGLGASFPFLIDDGVAAAFARTYALGLYHQRCGGSNALPFTRFVHGPCHIAPATVPGPELTRAQEFIAEASADFTNNPQHVAPQLKSIDTSLYPFVRQGAVDVSLGHHDAGDYSKYTINSAALVHTLIFAADSLPGVGALDNLGLPESGDGKSDVLQEAKWEADFLAKMQDSDGGFYFLVYPRDRAYENDVLPDHGDPQIVWPKNTAATAAAVAALAQAASSPLFRQQFPEAVPIYLQKARAGWDFLERAITKYGNEGAYQKLTHYGDDFMHNDEIAWAACELYLATGEDQFHQRLLNSFEPSDPATRRWGWWRLYESYGRAIRSYAFAARSGRVSAGQLDTRFLKACETEILAAANDQLDWAQQSAYATSFPTATKVVRGGGWYFSPDQAFDIAAGFALNYPATNAFSAAALEGMIGNLNYEAGCNPVNVCYLTGLGWKRPHEVVHQYAMNDRRILPPTGIPVGNIQAGFAWLDNYKQELGELCFPTDSAEKAPYPIYDRWGDSFNVQTEFVAVNQARALGVAALLMAQTNVRTQSWTALPASITIQPTSAVSGVSSYTATLNATNTDLTHARIVWEAQGQEPVIGQSFSFRSPGKGGTWVEAEAQLPDGRRIFGSTNIMFRPRVLTWMPDFRR